MPPKSILPPSWDVPEEFRRRLGEQAGRQRAMVAEGHLLLVLHRPPQKSETERTGRALWRRPDGAWQSTDLGSGAAALKGHLVECADLVGRYSRQEEAAASIADYFAILGSLSPLQRLLRNLHATLQEAREKVPADRDLINARDRAADLERTAEQLTGDVRNALDFAVARRTEEQAAASHQMAVSQHRLNVLAAFFFPMATLTAIFGTNLAHPLEQYVPAPFAFFGVIGAGLLLGCGLAGFLVTRSRRAKH